VSSELFKKTQKQLIATRLMGQKKHFLLMGGSRSGKSLLIIHSLIIRALRVKSRHAIIRKTFNSLKRSIWNDTLIKVLQLAFPQVIVAFNRSDYILTFPNGSEIYFIGLDNPKSAEKILGLEVSSLFFNEISELDFSSVQLAITRLAEKNELVKRCFYDMNPNAKNSWAYYLFIKGLNPSDNEPLVNPEDYGYFQINPIDNTENIDENYLKLLESMPEKERQRFLYGEFAESGNGAVYYAFDRERNVEEFSQSYQIGQVRIGLDFNVMPMCGVISYYVNNKFYIWDEAFLENSDTYKMSDYLKSKKYIGTIYPDSTGSARKTSGKSDHLILKEAGHVVHPTRNPFVTDRVNNINRLLRDERIIIHPRCKKLINDLEKVTWKNDELDQKTDKMLTHISDALGYLCWAIDPLTAPQVKSSTIQL
jgi:PBSX family phage terminase large subunit